MSADFSRKKAVRLHAEKRCRERYSEPPHVVTELTRLIKRERKNLAAIDAGRFHCNQDRDIKAWRTFRGPKATREQWRVRPDHGRTYRVVFDIVLERIVTFLPLRPEDRLGDGD
jgi:hypothetical protein